MNLTVKLTAQRLGVGTRVIINWLNAGVFPNAYKLNPNLRNSPYRIPLADIEAFEASRHK